jgi:hypothetical protein
MLYGPCRESQAAGKVARVAITHLPRGLAAAISAADASRNSIIKGFIVREAISPEDACEMFV